MIRRVAIAGLLAGCYHVDNSDCEIRCGADDACPSELTCSRGFCIADGQTCLDPDLVLAYSFDEETGPALHDDSESGNDAVVEGALRGPGMHGLAMVFDGDADRVIAPHAPSLAVAPAGALTVSFWIDVARQADFTADQLILGKVVDNQTRSNPFYEFGVEFDEQFERVEFFLSDGQTPVTAFAIVVPLDRFAHVAFTWDGRTVRGYLDGIEQTFATMLPPDLAVTDFAKDLFIGVQPDLEEDFKGSLDDIRLYKRALTTEEFVRDRDTGVAP